MQNKIIFNILDWQEHHEEDEDDISDSGTDSEENKFKPFTKKNEKYIIRVFGRTKDDKSVYLKIKDYTPYFYVKIPKWSEKQIDRFIDGLTENLRPKMYADNLIAHNVVKKRDFYGFRGNQKYYFLMLIFNNAKAMKAFARIFYNPLKISRLNKRPTKYKIYESNIDPFLRFMHIRDLKACGWVTVNNFENIDHLDECANIDLEIEANWNDIDPYKTDDVCPLKICSYDIECTSSDGGFPQPERKGDKIIQIGSTFSRYGEKECYMKHIITLDTCDPIPGVIVESYKTEREVLIAWFKLLEREDPDIMTGWNICGFDDRYIHGRAKLLNCHRKATQLGKLKEQTSCYGRVPKPRLNPKSGKLEYNKRWCEYCGFIEEHKLSSAGLGDNRYSYFRMIGRVKIDLMKVIQRDHRLSSYKLDNVLQEFIKDKIKKIDGSKLYTDSINGLYEENYITLEENGVKYKNGKKYQIIKLTTLPASVDKKGNTSEEISYCIQLDEDIEVFPNAAYKWCLVKDNVKPQEIFSLQEGTSADRAKLAKYCVQDCATCNLLMAKLNIVTNNRSMADVCHVPLSYIFIRGQGIKTLSLVAKKCRQDGYLIPILYKSAADEEKFEGAVVIHPKYKNGETAHDRYKRVLKEFGERAAKKHKEFNGQFWDVPIVVLDYASLYPSSMMEKNLSQEMYVDDPQYDNLEGYHYYDTTYKAADGSTVKCRFAKNNNGDYGIIPQILNNLLSERRAVKKLMAKEKDYFKKSVYDGQQLALKITANSIYGQTGSPVGPVRFKKIAASTTSIGRERLYYASEFAENHFKILSEASLGLLKNSEQTYHEMMNSIVKNIKLTEATHFDVPYRYDEDEYKILLLQELNLNYKFKRSDIQEITKEVRGKNIKFLRLLNNIEHKIYEKPLNEISVFKLECKVRIQYLLSEEYIIRPMTVYGDTDSVFVNLTLLDRVTNEEIMEKDVVLPISIEMGIVLGDIINSNLPHPQKLEYEKTLYPLCLIKKKKYTGNLYEFDPKKFYRKDMGIVLKRRDNANIVKKIVGGIVNIMLNEQDVRKIIKFTKDSINDLLKGKYQFEDFVTTKTLKANYKDRTSIAHVVLADRWAKRDPGNAPQINDRIPFAFIVKKKTRGMKQGEFIETPEFIIEAGLKIDYLYYLERQIMNPCVQFLGLVMDNPKRIFEKAIIDEMNKRKGIKPMSTWVTRKKRTKKSKDSEDSDEDFDCGFLIGNY
jgi:DNA polymerase elongation subunit (family B)